jgi:hypothetical protein
MEQYDYTTWQAMQDLQAGLESDAEVSPETSNAPEPQLVTDSAFYNTFATSQLRQPIENELPSYLLDDLRPYASTTPWTDDRSFQVGEHLQPLATQLPGPQPEDHFALQPYMNNNATAREQMHVFGHFSEFQNVLNPLTPGDQISHTNPCIHLGNQTSTLGYSHRDTDISTLVPSDDISQVSRVVSNDGNLYGPVPGVWSTPQPLQFASSPSIFPDPSQQLDLSSFNAHTSQGGLEHYPTQLHQSSNVATSLESSLHNVPGFLPETFDQTNQFGFQESSPYGNIGE